MESSPNNQKRKLCIAIIATTTLALLVIASFVLTPRKVPKTKTVTTPKVEAVSKDSTISKDSLKREWEQEDSIKREWVRELEREREKAMQKNKRALLKY